MPHRRPDRTAKEEDEWGGQEEEEAGRGRVMPLLLHLLSPFLTVLWALVSLPTTALLRALRLLSPPPDEAALARRYGDLRGRVAVVTGANAGIGLKTAETLAALGATVVLAVRNESRGQAALRRLHRALERRRQAGWPVGAVVLGPLVDLTDLQAVTAFAQHIRSSYPRLDLLVLNAGLGGVRRKTAEGLDVVMCANYLGHWLLTEELRPLLARDKTTEAPGRVVCLSSTLHQWAQLDARQSFLGYRRRDGGLWHVLVSDPYLDSKMAMLLLAHHVNITTATREAGSGECGVLLGVGVNPGAVYSDIWRFLPQVLQDWVLHPLFHALFLSTQQGCLTTVAACLLPPSLLLPSPSPSSALLPPYLTPYWTPLDILVPCDLIGPFVGWRLCKPRLPPSLATPLARSLHHLSLTLTPRKHRHQAPGTTTTEGQAQ